MLKTVKNFLGILHRDFKQISGYPKCDYGNEFSVDYEKYWLRRRGGGHQVLSSWQKQRADIALKIIKPGSSILDIGYGDSALLEYLKERGMGPVVGIDIDDKIFDTAQNLGINVVCTDANNLNNYNLLPEVDYITAFEIIEHMANSETFLYNIRKKARYGLIMSVPNSGYYAHRLRLLFGRFPLQWVVHPAEHLRFWTVTDMNFWVQSMDLEIEKMVLYEGLPILNKVFPKLFSQGILIYIKLNNH